MDDNFNLTSITFIEASAGENIKRENYTELLSLLIDNVENSEYNPVNRLKGGIAVE
jgi:hypothetical protein